MVLGHTWRLMKHGKHPEVHAFGHDRNDGKVATRCGLVLTPLTFDPGTPAGACPVCITHSAKADAS